ncbi:MAG: MOSC N-terminal beta barrel domain-containing protein [Rubrivivax sp.]
MSDASCRISALTLYPIKSCAGVPVDEALLIETGLDLDRAFMVVDEGGQMLTQRQWPRMALLRPTVRREDMVLRAPGMLTLHVRLDTVEAPTRVQVWRDIVKAFDMGNLAAQWFSDFLGLRARLVRFDPEQQRPSDPRWVGDLTAGTAFADGYPLLVCNSASLADLNARIEAHGASAPAPAIAMQRFRPNLVLDGLHPFDEDALHELTVSTEDGPVVLRLVKPCVRCGIPDVDPEDASVGVEPGATLARFRSDPRMDGGITFGVNAVVVEGVDRVLRVGQTVSARFAFD